jgi:hypothetical protein
MATTEQKKKLLKAKIAVALHDELGRVPKKEEIENVFLMARVMYKAVLGLHFQRQTAEEERTAPPLLSFMFIVSLSQNLYFVMSFEMILIC